MVVGIHDLAIGIVHRLLDGGEPFSRTSVHTAQCHTRHDATRVKMSGIGLLCIVGRLGGLRIVLALVETVLEFFLSLAQVPRQLRKLGTTEEDQNDHEQDAEFGATERKRCDAVTLSRSGSDSRSCGLGTLTTYPAPLAL